MTGITRQRAAEVIGEYLNGRVEHDGVATEYIQ